MKAVYFDEPNCYVCPAYNSGNSEPCAECVKNRHYDVNILSFGGSKLNKAVIRFETGNLKSVFIKDLSNVVEEMPEV